MSTRGGGCLSESFRHCLFERVSIESRLSGMTADEFKWMVVGVESRAAVGKRSVDRALLAKQRRSICILQEQIWSTHPCHEEGVHASTG